MMEKKCLLKKFKQELITMCNSVAQGFSCPGSESLMNHQRVRIRINYCLDPDQIYRTFDVTTGTFLMVKPD
jgi:hypothetical protein